MSIRSVLDLESPTHVLRDGALLAMPGGPVLTGMEVDATREVEEQDSVAFPVVVHGTEGRLPPFRPGSGPRVAALRPVAVEGGRWGVVWGEAVPPDGHEGAWSSQWVTSLRYAEWSGSGWGPAGILLSSRFNLRWTSAGMVQTSRGTSLVLIRQESMATREILFGSVAGGFVPISLPDGAVPIEAAATAWGDSVEVVAYLHDPGKQDWWLAVANSADAGRSWSPATSLPVTPSDVANRIRIHRLGQTTHILWEGRGGTIEHASNTDGVWSTDHLRPSGSHSGWASGVDSCGRLRVVWGRISTRLDEPDFETSWWLRRWSEPVALVEARGVYLFDGLGQPGKWSVAWSGFKRGDEPDIPMRIWTWSP